MSASQKRILNDYRVLMKNTETLHESGVHFQFDEDNLSKMKALIIGPPDTPYENGFYFFHITFPPEYPNLPPKFTYATNFRKTRFNPNLYVCGKVCLSLLNTWHGGGEGWTPANNVMSILNSIQALVLNDYPLVNEPGYEIMSKEHENYNEVIRHENLYTAVHRMIKLLPDDFKCFDEIVKKYFLKNLDWYLRKTAEYHLKYNDKKTFSCKYQHLSVPNEYLDLFKKLVSLAKSVSKELNISVEIPDLITQQNMLSGKTENNSASSSSTSVESDKDKCKGKTIQGKPCRFKAKENGYCKIHGQKVDKETTKSDD